MSAADPFELSRFIAAQDRCYDTVVAELRSGRKRSHWIWFVFPQLAGLGHSPTARRFGISGPAEARAYLEHPVLGARLRECARILVDAGRGQRRSAEEIFGFPDHLKVRSSMTLFERVAGTPADVANFAAVLDQLYAGYPDGRTDPATLALLG